MQFNFINLLFGGDDNADPPKVNVPMTFVNPATSLPMVDSGIDGMGGIDVGGSPFGMDIHSSMNDISTDFMGSNPWE